MECHHLEIASSIIRHICVFPYPAEICCSLFYALFIIFIIIFNVSFFAEQGLFRVFSCFCVWRISTVVLFEWRRNRRIVLHAHYLSSINVFFEETESSEQVTRVDEAFRFVGGWVRDHRWGYKERCIKMSEEKRHIFMCCDVTLSRSKREQETYHHYRRNHTWVWLCHPATRKQVFRESESELHFLARFLFSSTFPRRREDFHFASPTRSVGANPRAFTPSTLSSGGVVDDIRNRYTAALRFG